jgi:hypothetical protein
MIIQKSVKRRYRRSFNLKNFYRNVRIKLINSIEKITGLGDDMPMSDKFDAFKIAFLFSMIFIPCFYIFIFSIVGK